MGRTISVGRGRKSGKVFFCPTADGGGPTPTSTPTPTPPNPPPSSSGGRTADGRRTDGSFNFTLELPRNYGGLEKSNKETIYKEFDVLFSLTHQNKIQEKSNI